MNEKRGTVLFIPHGGGPLPILRDPHHKKLVKFLENIKSKINKPSSTLPLASMKVPFSCREPFSL